MKIYIAAPFFNQEQLNDVIDVENILKDNNLNYFSPRSFGVIKEMTNEEKQARMKYIYEKNVEELNSCDVILVLLDHKDTGTTWELGYVSGLNFIEKRKTIVTVSFLEKPVNVMLRYCIDAHVTNIFDLNKIIIDIRNNKPLLTIDPDVDE